MFIFQSASVRYAEQFIQQEKADAERLRSEELNSIIDRLREFPNEIHAQTMLARQYFRLDEYDTDLHVNTIFDVLDSEQNANTYSYLLALETLMDLIIDAKNINRTDVEKKIVITPYTDAFTKICDLVPDSDFSYSTSEEFIFDMLLSVTNGFWIYLKDENKKGPISIQDLSLRGLRDSDGRSLDEEFREKVLLPVARLILPDSNSYKSTDLLWNLQKLHATVYALNLCKIEQFYTPDIRSIDEDPLINFLSDRLALYSSNLDVSDADGDDPLRILMYEAMIEKEYSSFTGIDLSHCRSGLKGLSSKKLEDIVSYSLLKSNLQFPERLFSIVLENTNKMFYGYPQGDVQFASTREVGDQYKKLCFSRIQRLLSDSLRNAEIGLDDHIGSGIAIEYTKQLRDTDFFNNPKDLYQIITKTLDSVLAKAVEKGDIQKDHADFVKEYFVFHLGGIGVPPSWSP